MATKEDFNTKRVLLVDDSSTARQIIKKELIQMGFDDQNIRDAADGKQAVNLLTKAEFHLIISDLHMPNMDGIALLKAVKRNARLKRFLFYC